MNDFEVLNGSRELLDLVQPLWEKLNKHHEANAKHFVDRYRNLTFEVRKNKFINDKNLNVNIDLFKDNETNLYIGYCISTIDKDLVGEIDSLFVENEYRKFGLGDKMMNRALEWLNHNQVKKIIIGVAAGNESVLDFYKRYGFYRRTIILEQIKK